MVPRTIRFDPAVLQRIDECGEAQGDLVRKAVTAWFDGDVGRWQRRYEAERTARLRAESRLNRVREAVILLGRTAQYERLTAAVG